MKDIYQECPVVESERYLLRLIHSDDVDDLFKVYSDKNAVPFFNSDNCDGDLFYYETKERTKKAVEFWIWSYEKRYFVRFTIVDKQTNQAVGTIETFPRDEKGFLRLDLRSDYETEKQIAAIVAMIDPVIYEAWQCNSILTKAASYAIERVRALKAAEFVPYPEGITGKDGTHYDGYWCIKK